MPFKVDVFAAERRIEIVYPAQPTAAEIAEYATKLRGTLDGMTSSFCVLVDQRQTRVMTPELQEAVAQLVPYAVSRGMRRGARVVGNAVAGLQVWRVHRDVNLAVPTETFTDVDEARAWLHAEPF